jgi:hypothetical protein
MASEIKIGAKLEIGVPQQLFQTRIKMDSLAADYPYGVAPDGSRFLINTPTEADDASPMIVVLNWMATLKKQ